MNDPESFLSRWSRRKREAGPTPDAATDDAATAAAAAPKMDARSDPTDATIPVSTGTPEERDSAKVDTDALKLPAIESITAGTDIRPFLAPGVPLALRNAALRRAWLVDPLRDAYINPADYDWDFTAPGLPGFDLSPPTDAMRRYADTLFSPEAKRKEAPLERESAEESEDREIRSVQPTTPDSRREIPVDKEKSDVSALGSEETQRDASKSPIEKPSRTAALEDDSATQQNDATQKPGVAVRGHGKAVPR